MSEFFVEPVVEPGKYICRWKLPAIPTDGKERELFGSVALEPYLPPFCDVYGDVPYRQVGNKVSFPQTFEYPLVTGRLQNNMDIVLVDAVAEPFMLDSGFLHSRAALVGLGVAQVPEQRYSVCRVQVTGLDPLFGRPPLREVAVPRNSPFIDATFSARGEPASSQVWKEEGIEIRCSYDMKASGPNFYHHELSFVPIVTLKAEASLTLDEWLDDWVAPLVWLTTLATGQQQKISWLGLKSTSDQSPPDGATEATAQVFGAGISQAPYRSTGRPVDDEGRRIRSLIALSDSGLSLPALLRRSKSIEATANPFPELYRLVLMTELPERSRFLYLVQALEGLHGFENRVRLEASAEEHRTIRSAVLKRLAGVLDRKDADYLRDTWPNRPPGNLARVLQELNTELPSSASASIEPLRETELGREFGQAEPVIDMLRGIRNNLAHGDRGYDNTALAPWNDVLDRLARAHMLRLLDCPQSVVEGAIVAED